MRKRGFTLIEVTVSVVILGVLAGLAAATYTAQRRRSEYNGMRGTVISLVSAAKSQYYATSGAMAVPTTASTAQTNTKYQLSLQDGRFYNYRVINVAGQPFGVTVQYAGPGNPVTTYTFNYNGTQVACTPPGPDCLTP